MPRSFLIKKKERKSDAVVYRSFACPSPPLVAEYHRPFLPTLPTLPLPPPLLGPPLPLQHHCGGRGPLLPHHPEPILAATAPFTPLTPLAVSLSNGELFAAAWIFTLQKK